MLTKEPDQTYNVISKYKIPVYGKSSCCSLF